MKAPGKLKQLALELGFDRDWAERLVTERPGDIERWAALGAVPPEEDPRNS